MKKILMLFLASFNKKPKELTPEEAVKRSVGKYKKTYKLLEKHDKAKQPTPFLAEKENIEGYFRQV